MQQIIVLAHLVFEIDRREKTCPPRLKYGRHSALPRVKKGLHIATSKGPPRYQHEEKDGCPRFKRKKKLSYAETSKQYAIAKKLFSYDKNMTNVNISSANPFLPRTDGALPHHCETQLYPTMHIQGQK